MNIMISIVCPFYNEEKILEKASGLMLENLESLNDNWELILVDDGSTDTSRDIAKQKEVKTPNLKLVTYNKNQGRGYALKRGIEAANGDIIVTTEIDCSWGEDIVHRLASTLKNNPTLDMVIASTNLPGGGYINVPKRRVNISKLGNKFLRYTSSEKITMFTGMTRGYRTEFIKHIPISENGKEFHLDVIAKALAFGCKFSEIPATLTWQDQKLSKVKASRRQSSSNIPKLIRSHMLFGLGSKPYRYLFVMALGALTVSLIFFAAAFLNLLWGNVSIFLLTLSILSLILTVLLGGLGVLALQQNAVLRELWMLRRKINRNS